MSNIKVVSIKFNMDKESDRKFYEKLSERENGVYGYISTYAKVILCRYLHSILNDKDNVEKDINLYDEIIGRA